MKFRWPWILLVVLGVSCGAGQPGEQPDAVASSQDTVRITSIAPDPDGPLRVGERAAFRVEVNYTLASADSGTVTLVIQRGESGSMPLGSETQVIQRGSGRIVLTKSVEIPDTRTVQVFTPLTRQGGTSTSVADTRAYRVVKG